MDNVTEWLNEKKGFKVIWDCSKQYYSIFRINNGKDIFIKNVFSFRTAKNYLN